MRPDTPRPLYAGPEDGPEPPFPVRVSGKVIKGFGRGSKELGIPTANIPVEGLSIGGHDDLASGVYFGWAGLDVRREDLARQAQEEEQDRRQEGENQENSITSYTSTNTSNTHSRIDSEGRKEDNTHEKGHDRVFPMVMSIGWNPFYKNTVRSVEVHILAPFPTDFYGAHLALVILGFIRPEYDYVSVEALVADIRTDIEVARRSIDRPTYQRWREDEWLLHEICSPVDGREMTKDRKEEGRVEDKERDVVR